jgi:hypothetical protein
VDSAAVWAYVEGLVVAWTWVWPMIVADDCGR